MHRSRDPEMHRSCPVWCQVNAQAGIANGLFGPVVSEEMPHVLPELPRPVAQLEDALSRVYYAPAPDTSGAGLLTKALRFLRRSDPRKSPGEHSL